MNTLIKKVLLVEDDNDDCDFFETALSVIAPQVMLRYITYCDVMVKEVDEFAPDLIVMDMNLPRKDGIDCLKDYRAERDSPPIIICSGSFTAARIEAIYASGAELVYEKCNNLRDLERVIAILLQIDWTAKATIREQFKKHIEDQGLNTYIK